MITVPSPTYGRLTVVGQERRNSVLYWRCRCACGAEKVIAKQSIVQGRTKSCGCLEDESRRTASRTHGMSGTPTYKIWLHVIARCTDEKNPAYRQYGGRGITVCDRWRSFENFRADMGERPHGKSIDRINNDGPYSPDNCRWASRAEQARNTGRTINITIGGETLCLTDWAARTGRKYTTLYAAHRRGEDVAAILERAVDEARR